MEVLYTVSETEDDLRGILELQRANLPQAVSKEEAQSQGFVTVEHDIDLLRRMQDPYPHIIAKEGARIIGYALVMLREMREDIPVLIPMFAQIDAIVFQGRPLNAWPYCVMGQICIDKQHRGSGVFAGLYKTMYQRLKDDFDMVVTEVSARNMRSLRAHQKVGFIELKTYSSDTDRWIILGLQLKDHVR